MDIPGGGAINTMALPHGMTITTEPSCVGYVDRGMMVETVYDEHGAIVAERKTPFEEWNRL